MRLVILVCQLGLILRINAQIPYACVTSPTNRPPENMDMTVVCSTEYMDLSIYLCPIYHALYNEDLMVLNNQNDTLQCFGTADWSVNPPVLKFRVPLKEISSCNSNFELTTEVGTGFLTNYSIVQYVISGNVTSINLPTLPSAGRITNRSQILYKYSCSYPMHYFMNTFRLGVSDVSLVIRDNNSSFITTLSVMLYKDKLYRETLTMPLTGLNPNTRIYVAVKATNLRDRFNVLLDRCYATTSSHPRFSRYHDLFVGCEYYAQTKVELNGESQWAHFSFEAFRFDEHRFRTVSTFYLHCVTRLCEVSSCSALKPHCGHFLTRLRRHSNTPTITSAPILVGKLSPGVTVGPRPTDIPSFNQTKKTPFKNGTDPYYYNHYYYDYYDYYDSNYSNYNDVFDGGSSLSCYSSPLTVVAIVVCNVILTICFSV